jgi:tetratricopeptide (TPR) repeat protein
VIAAAAIALLWIAFRLHVIGDYSTESDFYGGYVDGARLFQQGHPDPSRYPVAGPGYDAALALVGFVVRDLFTAARLLSVASAVGILVLWRSLLVRRLGPDTALWAVLFLAANPVFVRYGYSATGDMFTIFLQAASLHALLGPGDRAGMFRGGVLAALATLTRYNSIFLVPFGVIQALWLAPTVGRSRARTVFALLAGFVLVAGPWVAFSLATGHVPGASLFGKFTTFYTVGDNSRNVQDMLPSMADSLEQARSFEKVAGQNPVAFALRSLAHVPEHLVQDARVLLGWPVAITALVGLALGIAGGLGRALLPVGLAGALVFATLVPIYYSDRYSLAIAPAYMALAAAAASSRLFALRIRGRGMPLKWLVLLVPLGLSIRDNVALQKDLASKLPREVFPAAAALKRDSPPGARVMCRKAHIGYYAGRPTVPFPRFRTLAELGAYCREKDVDYVYFSWYEAMLRPEVRYLIDTTAVVPGLTRVADTVPVPSVLYRVGPEFGSEPAWLADPAQRGVHLARANVRVLERKEAALSRVALAAFALDQSRPDEALALLDVAMRDREPDAVAWQMRGHALRGLGHMLEAEVAYRRALALDPRDQRSRLGLEWARRGIRGVGPTDFADTTGAARQPR